MSELLNELRAWSALEITAVVLAVGYLVLAIRRNILCWVCAAGSTAIYVYLFVDVRLYMESALNVFYFAMAVYGFAVWYRGAGNGELPVTRWAWQRHAVAIGAVLAASAASGYLLDTRSGAAFPYIDSLTTWAAIWATFLVARKVLENWWYWLAIDSASIVIYWLRDLPLTTALFVFYVLLIPAGIVGWTRSWRAGATA